MTIAINLGGTIALGYEGDKPVSVSGSQLIDDHGLEVIEVNPVQSHAMTWKHLVEIRTALRRAYAQGERRFLIFTGTATADDFLYYISLIRPDDARVLVMVSMRPAELDSPTPLGLERSLRWLSQDGAGVALSWGEQIEESALVEKVFRSRWVFESITHEVSLPDWRLPLSAHLSESMPNVLLLSSGIGLAERQAELLQDTRMVDGLVLDSYSGGNIHPLVATRVQELAKAGLPVVLSTRSRPGSIQPKFPNVDGASFELLTAKVMGAAQLDAHKCRIRLAVGLAADQHVAELFETW